MAMLMHPFFNPLRFGTEFAYTAIIVILCFVIYYKTKEIYSLTKYSGIKHFRSAFLLFGISYAVGFVFQIVHFSTTTLDLFFPMRPIMPIVLVLTGYFSTMAIFHLVYNIMWKKINENQFLVLSNILAVFLSLFTFIYRSPEIMAFSQLILLAFAVIISLYQGKKSKRLSQAKVLYFLVLIFWLFNVFVLGPRIFLPFEVKLIFEILSLAVFFAIYHKVSKWTK